MDAVNELDRPVFFFEDRDQPWAARLIPVGGRFGAEDCLVNRSRYRDLQQPMVEFYDRRWTEKFDPVLGQFVSRYYMDTFVLWRGGLDLCAHVPTWNLSADAIREVVGWAIAEIGRGWQPALPG